jgi:hypothetical protein
VAGVVLVSRLLRSLGLILELVCALLVLAVSLVGLCIAAPVMWLMDLLDQVRGVEPFKPDVMR